MAEEHPNAGEHHDPLERRDEVRGRLPGNRAVRIQRHRDFSAVGEGVVRARRVEEPKGVFGRLGRLLLGKPLTTAEEGGERLNKPIGLAIMASDNISSSAYATEEIMRVLILAGAGALTLTMPITAVIVALIIIVVISYRQVIAAYPEGGGSYIVAHDGLGKVPGLVAAAALLTDYILTVAVSMSAGVAAITSMAPALLEHKVEIAVVLVIVMMVINLRGVGEAGRVFAVPTYLFMVGILGLVLTGLLQVATGTLGHYSAPPEWLEAHGADALGIMLVLRAFASGSVALTGTEAVSNGVPAFKPPEVKNAQTVLVVMGSLFATVFVGLSFLAGQIGVVPDPHEAETLVSQIGRTLFAGFPSVDFGGGSINIAYGYVQVTTALILVLAANTAFSGFPRLSSVLARDQYLPRQFAFRGDRLAFTGGIIVLAICACALIIWYQGSVTSLIPLYTVGVFIAFTLSQSGLVLRWWRERAAGWQVRLASNGLGALTTGVVAVVVGVSKFFLGAWMILVALPLMVWLMWAVNRHYERMGHQTEPETPIDAEDIRVRAVVPVANLELPARQAIAYAEAIAGAEHAVTLHIADESHEESAFRAEYREMRYEAPLVIIDSPYRSLIGPLMAYIRALRETHPNDTVTVVLPEYVPNHWWERLLHNQTAWRIRAALLFGEGVSGVVVVTIPYHAK